MNGIQELQRNQNSAPTVNPNTGTKKEKLTQRMLREVLVYEEETGIFTWRAGRPGASKGKEAGWVDHRGYRVIQLSGKNYRAHRLAWLYVYGYFPEQGVDHINAVPDDNRLENLRVVSQQCNIRNASLQKRSKTGVKGVTIRPDTGRYLASITVNKQKVNLGYFSCLIEATAHRLAAEQCLGWDACDIKSSAWETVKNYQGAEQ